MKIDTNVVVIQYLPEVKAMSFRLKERVSSSIDVDDLTTIGVKELFRLLRHYDGKQNESFWDYAEKIIYRTMFDYLRSFDLVCRYNKMYAETGS